MENYYLIPANLIYQIQGSLGSIAGCNPSIFDDLSAISHQLGDNDIVLLSDTEVENLKCGL